MTNCCDIYKKNSIEHSSKEQQLLLLIDGAYRFAVNAKIALENKELGKAHELMLRVQDIFLELMVTLDRTAGEWANDLFEVYSYIISQLIQANIKKDEKILSETIDLIDQVRGMWHEASEISKQNK